MSRRCPGDVSTQGRDAPLRVLIVDDDHDVRFILRQLAAAEGDGRIVIVDEAGDGRAAVEAAARCRPHVILLDVRMPEIDGIAAIPALRQVVPEARIFMYSASEDRKLEALERGADDWIPKLAGWPEIRRRLLD